MRLDGLRCTARLDLLVEVLLDVGLLMYLDLVSGSLSSIVGGFFIWMALSIIGFLLPF